MRDVFGEVSFYGYCEGVRRAGAFDYIILQLFLLVIDHGGIEGVGKCL